MIKCHYSRPDPFTLKVEDEVVKENPSMEEIASALASPDWGKASFAILGRSEFSYMQMSGSIRSGFSLEYQDGSLKRHYSCPGNLSLEEATKAFQSYAKGDKQWQVAHNWELMKIHAKRTTHLEKPKIDRSPLALLIYVLVAVCFFAVFWGSRKGANQQVWLSVFFASAAAFVAASTTQAYKKGRFSAQFYTVTRSESPFQFWLAVILGYSISIMILAGIILFLKKR